MKKSISLFIVFILLSSLVVAQGGPKGVHEPGTGVEESGGLPPPEPRTVDEPPEVTPVDTPPAVAPEDEITPEKVEAKKQLRTQERTGEHEGSSEAGMQKRVQNQERLQTGLENALSNVKNENARTRLQQNMDAFQKRYQERLQRMEGLEIEEVDEETGAVELKAKEPVKYFGFIKGKATKRFQIDNQGQMTEKQPWYRFMYSESQE